MGGLDNTVLYQCAHACTSLTLLLEGVVIALRHCSGSCGQINTYEGGVECDLLLLKLLQKMHISVEEQCSAIYSLFPHSSL